MTNKSQVQIEQKPNQLVKWRPTAFDAQLQHRKKNTTTRARESPYQDYSTGLLHVPREQNTCANFMAKE